MMVEKRGWKSQVLELIYKMVLLCIVAYTLLPIVWAVGNSFRLDDSEIFRYVSVLSIHTFIPKTFALANYRLLFSSYEFLRPLYNSFLVALITVGLGFVCNGLAGFAFAKFDFKGKSLLFSLYLFSFMIPFEMIAVPLYRTVGTLGMLETRAALVLPMLANGMIVFLYRQFYQDIPDALIESAVLDGAGTLRVFFQLLVPLSKPVIISASLMAFIQQWDAFLWPLVAATDKKLKVIQVAISEFTTENAILWGVIFAATSIAIVIPAGLLIPLQKYFVRGISSSGLKE